ncbi:MAG: membrane protein [Candidatus Synechococcus spongiarum 142]|uniref:Membrane protein n=1 Tax=Candidatus Synechococcus spongiarum 142 TaxID=1608213 RepID=A0A6N3XBA3_9SYNE|nr:MAG: membrane protein [Candidatus Synechococcus spongiarum 142]
MPPAMKRPAWLNWLYLLIFLWSSWQLAGMWWQRLNG